MNYTYRAYNDLCLEILKYYYLMHKWSESDSGTSSLQLDYVSKILCIAHHSDLESYADITCAHTCQPIIF